MNHSEISKFVIISLFSTVQIWGLKVNLKKSFWLIFCFLDPYPVNWLFFSDPDPEPGGLNFADPTNQIQ